MTTGIVTGIVKVATEDGAPASSSTVRAYERDTGLLVAEGITDVDGTIILQGLDSLKLYTFTGPDVTILRVGLSDKLRMQIEVKDSN